MTEPATKGRAAAGSSQQIVDDAHEEAARQIAAAEDQAQREATQVALGAYGDLAKAIVWVAGQIKSVPKNGFNNFHSYSYATKDDIIEALKPLMEEAGLAVVPHFRGAERGPEDSRGYVDLFANWEMQILHRSGGTLMVAWQSESMDNSDKNINKAITAAKKSFYRALFDIPDGEPDAEHTSNAVSREGGARSSERSSGGQVGVRELLDYKAKHEVTNVQLDWVITRPEVGATAGTKLVALPKEKLPLVLAGMERVVAERAKRDQDTGEPLTQAPAEGIPAPEATGDYTSFDPANSDDDIPF